MMKLQPDIFRRFFFRKQADNKSDKFLPIIFIIIIAVSTSVISLSTFELYDYKIRIESFLSNEWNKIYDLYLGDTDRKDVKSYLVDMEKKDYLDFKQGFREYPRMISIKSKDGYIENILAYAFSSDFKEIIKNVDFDTYEGQNCLFLDPAIMQKLQVQENDLVFIKIANLGGAYLQALHVKPIEDATRIKCYFLDNYLHYAANCKIRFYFDKADDLFNFMFSQLVYEQFLPTPLNFGFNKTLFGSFSKNQDIKSDFVLPINYVHDNENLKFKDKISFNFEKGQKYSKTIDHESPLMLSYDEMIQRIESGKGKVQKVDFIEKKGQGKFFVEIDMATNFSSKKIKRYEVLMKKQEAILSYYQNCDSLAIVSSNDEFKRDDTYLYLYYTKLDSIALSKEILNSLNYKNVRWDTGKWNSIINLNESLKKGEKNTILLIFVNLIIFLFFLSIKFLLRLKLEFHTIGVLKCFGYADKDIYNVYILGYLIHVLFGLILGFLPFSYGIGLLAGYDIAFINQALLNSITSPVNFITGYGLVLFVATFLAVAVNLNRLVKRANIYELIKYEG